MHNGLGVGAADRKAPASTTAGSARSEKGLPRLTEPMVRENGVLRIATWDEALDRAALGLRAAIDLKGADGVGIFSCSKATNEMNFIAGKFIRQVLRSNNIDSCNRT
jgi:formate dehydrogenase major subunit